MTTENEAIKQLSPEKHNAHIDTVTALESKLFELVKQESPDDYSAFEVLAAIQLLRQRLIGISGLIQSAEVLIPRGIVQPPTQNNL